MITNIDFDFDPIDLDDTTLRDRRDWLRALGGGVDSPSGRALVRVNAELAIREDAAAEHLAARRNAS